MARPDFRSAASYVQPDGSNPLPGKKPPFGKPKAKSKKKPPMNAQSLPMVSTGVMPSGKRGGMSVTM